MFNLFFLKKFFLRPPINLRSFKPSSFFSKDLMSCNNLLLSLLNSSSSPLSIPEEIIALLFSLPALVNPLVYAFSFFCVIFFCVIFFHVIFFHVIFFCVIFFCVIFFCVIFFHVIFFYHPDY